ncbi:MAG TPA: DUF1223 domain-containing protein [Acetobacteraceae bacterium]|nr:DUF1223 domain-containing protein [Acetobacteraceae bacterium]
MRRRSLMLGALAASLPVAGSADADPVVLELFTSQGCSSCPPADALLGELERQPAVIALAWHVDYWNGLGWHDPFATRFATDRQRAYAARLRTEVYTPAVVVNGGAVVVGSDRAAIAQAIARMPPPRVPIALRAGGSGVVASFDPALRPATVLLASYDPVRDTAVGAGENTGRTLREYHVVRSVAVAPREAVAAGRVVFPPLAPGRGAVLLMHDASLRVIGAAALAASG